MLLIQSSNRKPIKVYFIFQTQNSFYLKSHNILASMQNVWYTKKIIKVDFNFRQFKLKFFGIFQSFS